jgi:hypothetical protein
MTTNVLIAFYSTYGHIHRMALAVSEAEEFDALSAEYRARRAAYQPPTVRL